VGANEKIRKQNEVLGEDYFEKGILVFELLTIVSDEEEAEEGLES
jgi:hypothetical protein